jgi:phosphoribosylamine-glycine ligase
MQSLNVLIVTQKKSKYVDAFKQSGYLNKLYSTSEEEVDGVISLNFNTFKELAQKCRTLQIDVVLVEEEKWVMEGIANVMKKNYVNCFAPTTDWTNLGLSHKYARTLLQKYKIDAPSVINLPETFPILVKGDGVLKIANSLQDIISIKEGIFKTSAEISKTVFLEEYLYGEKQIIISVFDGKHLLTFPNDNIDRELLKDYSKKLETMFLEEKANFVGFINSELIENNGILYNTGFKFNFRMPDLGKNIAPKPNDILYICLSAIYQKLNEIEL